MSGDAVAPVCAAARETIIAFAKTEHDGAILSMALEGLIEIEDGSLESVEAELAARHIETCEHCTKWLDVFYPDRTVQQAEMKRRKEIYCCSSMQHAVNDAEAETRFSFILFRSEDPCWCINDDLCFARHCPWCGAALPDRPFEDDRRIARKSPDT